MYFAGNLSPDTRRKKKKRKAKNRRKSPHPSLDEVRMFVGEPGFMRTGFNSGHSYTPIEWRRWNGRKWVTIEGPELPQQRG